MTEESGWGLEEEGVQGSAFSVEMRVMEGHPPVVGSSMLGHGH